MDVNDICFDREAKPIWETILKIGSQILEKDSEPMDTSEQYIKMCDCPEIQEQELCSIRDGSSFYDMQDVFLNCKEHGKIADGGSMYKYCPICGDGLLSEVDTWTGVYPEFGPSEYTWLPRQDQLQRMFLKGELHNNPLLLTSLLNAWAVRQTETQAEWQSMEQLWLAFVMHELYGKKWDGDSWSV